MQQCCNLRWLQGLQLHHALYGQLHVRQANLQCRSVAAGCCSSCSLLLQQRCNLLQPGCGAN
jgi:hypothetical protein